MYNRPGEKRTVGGTSGAKPSGTTGSGGYRSTYGSSAATAVSGSKATGSSSFGASRPGGVGSTVREKNLGPIIQKDDESS